MPIHQQKVGSLECFMVAKSSAEEFSKTDIVEQQAIFSQLFIRTLVEACISDCQLLYAKGTPRNMNC